MKAVLRPTGPQPEGGAKSAQRLTKSTTFPCGEQPKQLDGEYPIRHQSVNPLGALRGVAASEIHELMAALPHVDFSAALGRAMLDDAVREERVAYSRRSGARAP
jgi:hypothetical protein